jgi:predicted transcriptional regulator of viral defense system
MEYLEFKRKLELFPVLSLSDIKKIESDFHAVQLIQWQRKGLLERLRNGYYIFTEKKGFESLLYTIANKIYPHSYVSFESALSYYHLIPEQVYSVTSATSGHKKTYHTPRGTYIYQQIKPELFFGYTPVNKDGYTFLMATPEKVILDYLYIHKDMKTEGDFFEWRINPFEFKEVVKEEELLRLLAGFQNKALEKRVSSFLHFMHHA